MWSDAWTTSDPTLANYDEIDRKTLTTVLFGSGSTLIIVLSIQFEPDTLPCTYLFFMTSVVFSGRFSWLYLLSFPVLSWNPVVLVLQQSTFLVYPLSGLWTRFYRCWKSVPTSGYLGYTFAACYWRLVARFCITQHSILHFGSALLFMTQKFKTREVSHPLETAISPPIYSLISYRLCPQDPVHCTFHIYTFIWWYFDSPQNVFLFPSTCFHQH